MSPKPPLWIIRVFSDLENDKYEDIPFTPGKFLLSETIAIEEYANLTWPQVITGVGAFRTTALRAVIWIMRKRSNPKLKLSQVEFSIEDIQVLDPDVMPEYGYVSPDELEPEVALEDESEAVQDTPKEESSNEPAPPLPMTPETPED